MDARVSPRRTIRGGPTGCARTRFHLRDLRDLRDFAILATLAILARGTGVGRICYGRAGVFSAGDSSWTGGLRWNTISFARFARFRDFGDSGDPGARDGGGPICYGRGGRLLGWRFVVDGRAALEHDFICAICAICAISRFWRLWRSWREGRGGRICYGRGGRLLGWRFVVDGRAALEHDFICAICAICAISRFWRLWRSWREGRGGRICYRGVGVCEAGDFG